MALILIMVLTGCSEFIDPYQPAGYPAASTPPPPAGGAPTLGNPESRAVPPILQGVPPYYPPPPLSAPGQSEDSRYWAEMLSGVAGAVLVGGAYRLTQALRKRVSGPNP